MCGEGFVIDQGIHARPDDVHVTAPVAEVDISGGDSRGEWFAVLKYFNFARLRVEGSHDQIYRGR